MARMRDPEEVATAVLWLLSADSSYATGATIDVQEGSDPHVR
jgi:NAD(P)-dependent dehydrogenase (short-subunit alcohol dehydrogenase family)